MSNSTIVENLRKEIDSFSSQVRKERLANGMKFMHMPNPGTGSVAVNMYIPAGNYFEPQVVASQTARRRAREALPFRQRGEGGDGR